MAKAMLARSSSALLVWSLLCCLVERTPAGSRRKKEEDANKVSMPHHSFSVPLAYESVLDDWRVSGASLVERERVLLHPSVPERAAFVWNKAPILTNSFEVTVHFRVTGSKDVSKVIDDQSFALWYVYENVSASYNETQLIKASSWMSGLLESGMTLSGSKAKFQGLGAFFSAIDAKKNPKAVVSGIWNDGDRELVYGSGKDVPAKDAKSIDFRNTMNAAQFRLRVSPTSIEGHLKQSPSLSWNECFKLTQSVQPGGYLGISAWSGRSEPGTMTSDTIIITQLDVYNLDTTTIGEEMKDVSKEIQDAYREMLTDEHRHFRDQRSQTEHLQRLTTMVRDHIDATKPIDEKMFQDLEGLQHRVQGLGEDCKTLTKELQVVAGGDGPDLKDQIVGLRRLFTKDTATHKQRLEVVKKNVAEVKQKRERAMRPDIFNKVAKQQEEMASEVVSRSSQRTWMVLGMLVMVAVIGWLMHKKMAYYERKHFL